MKKVLVKNFHPLKFPCMILLILLFTATPAYGEGNSGSLAERYQEYRRRLEGTEAKSQIASNGFSVIEEQVFSFPFKGGEATFIPALDRQYHRLAIFILGADGKVIYKTDQLETNNQIRGGLEQPNKGIAAVSFQDVNGDGLTDILLITFCGNELDPDKSQTYKVGDILFQQSLSSGQAFYRDYRISDKLNQYGMNKSIKFMVFYLVKKYSTEFLYTADTLDELYSQGFQLSTGESFYCEFEKWGKLFVAPGVYHMAEYSVFMLYLVNGQGNIVWSFQPMKDYESLYEVLGIVCEDIDGDGLKDILVLGDYLYEPTANESVVARDYSVYYQRNGTFYEDTDVKGQYPCGAEDTLDVILGKLRTYWGWN